MSTHVEPWPEADALFRSDARWLGGDDAYSLPLGDGRHLWLFGDSLIQSRPDGDRTTAHFVHNTVGIQTGDDPTTATMSFHWRGTDAAPLAVFDDDPGYFLWPGDGVIVDGRLVLFFMRVAEGVGEPLPPDADHVPLAGWRVAVVDDPGNDPATWQPRFLDLLDVPFAESVGAGGVYVEGDHLHVHAFPATAWRGVPTAGNFLGRWPLHALLDGDLGGAEWWQDGEWRPTARIVTRPDVVLSPPMTEFTLHPESDGWVATQLLSVRTGEVALRTATHPTSVWSDATVVHECPLVRNGDGEIIAYAAKSHPHIGDGDGHLMTYCSNARTFSTLYVRPDVYFPHCLRRRPTAPTGLHP